MSAEPLHPVELAVAAAWPPADWCDVHVVLACSGGPDSVALLRAVSRLKQLVGGRGRLFVAHLNHGLRGADAAADQAWLKQLCERLGLPLHAGTADVATLAADQGDGWEAAARAARYDFLARTAEQIGARWVPTGHNQDDQVETILHRLIRGTGLTGLAGMQKARPLSPIVTLVRPLLEIARAQVVEYLNTIGQDYRADATNADARFTRNRLRHQLLPLVRSEFNADFDAALLRLSEQAAESQQMIDGFVAEFTAKYVRIEWPPQATESGISGKSLAADRIQIDCRGPSGRPTLMVREVCREAWREANWPLQAMGFDQWQQLASLVAGNGGEPQISLPGNIRAQSMDGMLLMYRPSPDEQPSEAVASQAAHPPHNLLTVNRPNAYHIGP
jgi:tRNA(Ile)-lysidine synthase